jgi:RNA polymerase sigma-70 factor (ECF subfamily)
MNPPQETLGITSASLIVAIRRHDEAAWAQFVDLYGPLIYSWCRRSGYSPADSADLLQLVFVKVWTGMAGFQRGDAADSFRGWLAVVTRSVIVDFARSRQGKPTAAGGSAALAALRDFPAELQCSTQILPSDVRELAVRAMKIVRTSLTEDCQRIFELAILQEKSAPEVAALLNSTPAAVRKAKSRILHHLRAALGEFD